MEFPLKIWEIQVRWGIWNEISSWMFSQPIVWCETCVKVKQNLLVVVPSWDWIWTWLANALKKWANDDKDMWEIRWRFWFVKYDSWLPEKGFLLQGMACAKKASRYTLRWNLTKSKRMCFMWLDLVGWEAVS